MENSANQTINDEKETTPQKKHLDNNTTNISPLISKNPKLVEEVSLNLAECLNQTGSISPTTTATATIPTKLSQLTIRISYFKITLLVHFQFNMQHSKTQLLDNLSYMTVKETVPTLSVSINQT